jgi:hypothetical protein
MLSVMDERIDSDYLIVGAGAAGMAFADSLLTHSDATVTIVDKRHAPGGHWQEAYPFVRLHQPSAFYGVESEPLGQDQRDAHGTNAGFYELAGASEIRAYFEHVMRSRFLPTGRVTYLPSAEHTDDGLVRSLLADRSWNAKPRKRIVDTTYLEGRFTGSSPPPFEIAEGVRWVPAGGVANLQEPPERYVVIGAGKTALDVNVYLLEQGVPPESIQWIKPREAWWINRRYQQPFELVPDAYRAAAMQIEAMAQASSVDDLFKRLEAEGFFLRVDPSVEATMFRGAVVSEGELELLRRIQDVVRLGRIQRIEKDRIVLDRGSVPTTEGTLHVHCASRGLSWRPVKPIFEPDRITIQPYMWSFACFQAALLGVVEAVLDDDDERNQLCQPLPFWATNSDYVSVFLATMVHEQVRRKHPAVAEWAKGSRLNLLGAVPRFRDDPKVVEARENISRNGIAAATNLQKILAAEPPAAAPEKAEASAG